MARTPAQRGTFGRWLTAARESQFATQKQALAAYRRLAGIYISESEYAQWESGSRVPKEDNPKRLALQAFYGSAPVAEVAEAAPASGDQAMVAVLSRLADIQEQQLRAQEAVAIRLDAIVNALARLDETVAGGAIGLGEALGAALAGLGGTLPQSASEPDARRGSGGGLSTHSSSQTEKGR